MSDNVTAAVIAGAACILLSLLLLPLWLRRREGTAFLLWSSAFLALGVGLLGLPLSVQYSFEFLGIPVFAALLVGKTLSTAGLLSLYGYKRPIAFTALILALWLSVSLLMLLFRFDYITHKISYYFIASGVAAYAAYFFFKHPNPDKLQYHGSLIAIFCFEVVVFLSISCLDLWHSQTPDFMSSVTSSCLILGFLLFFLKAFIAVNLAIEYSERDLRKLAFYDPLTEALNRRGVFIGIEKLTTNASSKEIFAYLSIDIDHFKKINDIHGHSIGDRALVSFTNIVRKEIRETDIFGRTGGEEFAVFAAVPSEETALTIAERIRSKLEQSEIINEGLSIKMTASIGVALRQGKIANLESMLSQSDKALYEAKNTGRNRVILYENKDSAAEKQSEETTSPAKSFAALEIQRKQ